MCKCADVRMCELGCFNSHTRTFTNPHIFNLLCLNHIFFCFPLNEATRCGSIIRSYLLIKTPQL
jgi:hypothetical protein